MFLWVRQDLLDLLQSSPQELINALPNPQDAEEHFALGAAWKKLGSLSRAAAHWKKALQLNLRHFPSLYALSLIAFEQGQERQGQTWFDRAIRVDDQASEHGLYFQRELKKHVDSHERLSRWGVWCLTRLTEMERASDQSHFQLGKLLFEQNRFLEAAGYLRDIVDRTEIGGEAAEYLSYIYEHLYRGEELIAKTLDLAEKAPNRCDLFFNLAMVCQHDQRRLDWALHFFYLASREDPSDPGLRFSLEQAALEALSKDSPHRNDEFTLMFAHIYQGSVGVAKRYAKGFSDLRFPEDFHNLKPTRLWSEWLVKDQGPLGQNLKLWFGGDRVRHIHSEKRS